MTVATNFIPSKTDVELSTGKYLDMADPVPEAIDLEDIAHALGNLCRWNGHCLNYFSVAEHAVLVSKRLEQKGFSKIWQLAGLHHDDSEAFLCDIPKPLKPLLGDIYKELSDKLDEVICEGLGLPFDPDFFKNSYIKKADNWSLKIEAKHLLPSEGKRLGEDYDSRIVVPDYWLGGVTPRVASSQFLKRHRELTT